MGTVHLAEQKEPVHRRVALKRIELGMDRKAVLARFEAERRALSMMEHSCIATVLDAGVSAQSSYRGSGSPAIRDSYLGLRAARTSRLQDFTVSHCSSLAERSRPGRA